MSVLAKISAVGHYVPESIIDNHYFSKFMDTNDEWIQQRSGIKQRRFASADQSPSDLAVKAVENAISRSNTGLQNTDMIIVATLSPEHYFPGTSAFVQRKLKLNGVPILDLRAQCSGFLYALTVANSLVVSGQCKKVLLIGVEVHSRGLDMSNRGRDCSVLFGDGAGAVIIERSPSPEHGMLAFELGGDGDHAEKLWVEFPTMKNSPTCTPADLEQGGLHPRMDGRFVFKNAVEKLPAVVNSTLSSLNLKPKDIDTFLFHQANLRINEKVAEIMQIPAEKCPYNIDRYGNCSAASIPILLSEQLEKGTIKKGSLVCMAGFGSGFTWGASVMRWL